MFSNFFSKTPRWLKIVIGIFCVIASIFTILSIVAFIISIPPVKTNWWINALITKIAFYGNVFSITLSFYALILTILALIYVALQFEEAATANKIANKLRWTENLQKRLSSDRYKPITFTVIREYFGAQAKADEIFEFLFNNSTSLKVANKAEVQSFFDKFLSEAIHVFENFPADEPEKTYRDVSLIVSEIASSILEPTPSYTTVREDFLSIYLSQSKLRNFKKP